MADQGKEIEDTKTDVNTTPSSEEPMQTEEVPTQPREIVEAEEDEPRPEEERNLTDHLNKRLLESFLTRLDSGAMQFPPATAGKQEDSDGEFEDS